MKKKKISAYCLLGAAYFSGSTVLGALFCMLLSSNPDKWMDDNNKVRCYILTLMSNELRCQHEDMKVAKIMLTHLQKLYSEQSQSAHYEVSKRLFNAKIHEEQSVHDHCLTMIKDFE